MASVWMKTFLVLLAWIPCNCSPDLVVNVQTKNGDISQQEFTSFPDDDVVHVAYKLEDGRFSDVCLDFRKKIQIFKTIVLGEMDIAENPYEIMCFAIRMKHDEYVSPDAMAKLRQKNPNTIRIPEEDLGTQEIVLDHSVRISEARNINLNVRKFCGDVDVVHVSGDDLKFMFDNKSTPLNHKNGIQNLTSIMSNKKRCHSISNSNGTCVCRQHVCLSWYPCNLKYCHGEDADGKATEFRCGIKTCGKCRDFDFLVSEKNHCFWDHRHRL